MTRLLILATLLFSACKSTRQPYVIVLGTAQDGGYPQIACDQELCAAARQDPGLRRLVASALIVDPRTGKRWLLDATPDLPEQIELAREHGHPRGPGRPPLFDGIFLTHAHMGHYSGLLHLGRESYGSQTTPLHATERMGRFLTENGPWSLLFDGGHLEHRTLVSGQTVQLGEDLSITPIEVPHRPEFSDTVAFLVRGPERSLLFLPDIDKWERWDTPIEELISQVDVALLDGTFYDGNELPSRDMSEIPHPFVVESLERLGAMSADLRSRVRFFHLNHSNPLVDPARPQTRAVEAAGMAVARDGERHEL